MSYSGSFDFGVAAPGQFKDITSFLPAKQGGNMLLAPLAAPLITGLFSAGSSLFGANKAEEAARRSDDTARKIAQGQFDAQRAGVLESRELAKGNLGFGMFDKVFSAGTGADLDRFRQEQTAMFQRSTLDPMQLANQRDDFRARLGMEGSLEAKELSRRRNLEALDRARVERLASAEAMFGRIA